MCGVCPIIGTLAARVCAPADKLSRLAPSSLLGAIRASMLLVGAPGALRGYAFAWIIVGVERRGQGVRGDAVLDPMGDRGDDVMGRIVLRRRQAAHAADCVGARAAAAT